MGKGEILDAIRRCAEANGGKAIGKGRFEKLTGIAEAQWEGRSGSGGAMLSPREHT